MFKFILDDVRLRYDAGSHSYCVTFRKQVQNLSEAPLESIPARINIRIFPDDLELSTRYHQLHPLRLDEVSFHAEDAAGRNLSTELRNLDAANIELDIILKDRDTGEWFPLYKDETIEIAYSCTIAAAFWGPFLQRHVRFPSDRVSMRLIFPKGLVRVWGVRNPGTRCTPLEPRFKQQVRGGEDEFLWSVDGPEIDTRFQLRWRFNDGRERKLEEEFRREINEKALPDFRNFKWRDGKTYKFSRTQSEVVRTLWKAAEQGEAEMHGKDILNRIGHTQAKRLIDLFRKCAGWGIVIVPGTEKGCFRLAPKPDVAAEKSVRSPKKQTRGG